MTSGLADSVFVLIVAAVGCGAIGCGGDDSTSIAEADGGDATAASDTSTSDTSTGVDSSAPMDAGVGDAADSAVSDAAYDGPPVFVLDGGTPADAGPGGTTTSITCGAASCSIPADQCCVYPNALPPPDFSYACVAGAGCPDAGSGGIGPTALKCSSAANCPANQRCCMTQHGGGLITSDCQAACVGNQAQLCDPSLGLPDGGGATGCAQDAGVCSNNNIGDWGLPASFASCGGKGN